MLSVSAVIVTRGDVPLDQILDTFQPVTEIDEIIVYDNSKERDEKTWGRHVALARCRNRLIYSQDDDIVHEPDTIRRIIAAHHPGSISGCMWEEWSDGATVQGIEGGYSDLAFPGAGSIYDRETPLVAAARYLEHHPLDDFFRVWCDAIIGIIAPTVWLDDRFEVLPCADSPNRICNLPDAHIQKREAIHRARAVRDYAHGPLVPKRDALTLALEEEDVILGRVDRDLARLGNT
jgi:hypothetical protein